MNDLGGINAGLASGAMTSSLQMQGMGAQIINGTLGHLGGSGAQTTDGGVQMHTAEINAAIGKGTELDVEV